MTVSSDEASKAFDQIDVKSVCQLLAVVAQTSDTLVSRIEGVYLEHAEGFDKVLRFVLGIGWIVVRDDRLQLTKTGASAGRTEASVRSALVDALTHVSSPYRAHVAAYLHGYSNSGQDITYRPSITDRLRDTGLRDLLMELRIVEHRSSDDCYVLVPGREDIYAWALGIPQMPASRITQLHERKESLGRSAELQVLSYERQRLGELWWPHIEHVSDDAPYAPYDIRSITLDGSRGHPRFIEVKAVPADTYRFFWSRQELELAALLAERYFLYLVPVSNGTFDLRAMLEINDPYRTIYRNKGSWTTEEDVVVCTRR